MGRTIPNAKFEQYTGAVTLFFSGKKPELKTGRAILFMVDVM